MRQPLAGSFLCSLAVGAAFAMPVAAAPVRFVDATKGIDVGTCDSAAAPCRTVTFAMNQAVAGSPGSWGGLNVLGDEIHVAPGRYNRALGETFPIAVKSGVRLRSTSGAQSTVLDAGGSSRVLELSDTSSATSVEGFTITGGNAWDNVPPPCNGPCPTSFQQEGGGMRISGGAPVIRDNVFLDNQARGVTIMSATGAGRGGAIMVTASSASILNNVFRGNRALGGDGGLMGAHFGSEGASGIGGAVYFHAPGMGGWIVNNTFHSNAAIGGKGVTTYEGWGYAGGTGSSGAVYAIGPSIHNNIFADNAATGGRGGASLGPAAASAGALTLEGNTPNSNNLFLHNTTNGAASTDDTIGIASMCTGASPCASAHFLGEPSNLRISAQSPAAGTGKGGVGAAFDFDGMQRPAPPSIGAFEPSSDDPSRLLNISTRMQVLTGNDVMIAGFIVAGGSKTVAIVATGPSLGSFGITQPLANPTLTLVRSSDQAVIATNDDWQDAPNAAQLRVSGFAPPHPLEAGLLVHLPEGAYTAIVRGADSVTGVALASVYEVDDVLNPLANISSRGRVLAGDRVMIGGFVIAGDAPQTVAIVATGPSLVPFGIDEPLLNPTLRLVRSSDQSVVDGNDDWQQHPNAAQLQAAGFAPGDPREAGILITLPPGAYTAIVQGVDGGVGVSVASVFRVN